MWNVLWQQNWRIKMCTCFKGCYDYSTKSVAPEDWSTCSRVHQLNWDLQLPSRDAVLSVTKIKMQLNKLIFEDISQDRSYLAHARQHHHFILTGHDPTPTTISEGQIYPKLDLASFHEGADIVITQQAIMATCHNDSWWCGCLFPPELVSLMYIVSSIREWASTDIAETTARISAHRHCIASNRIHHSISW